MKSTKFLNKRVVAALSGLLVVGVCALVCVFANVLPLQYSGQDQSSSDTAIFQENSERSALQEQNSGDYQQANANADNFQAADNDYMLYNNQSSQYVKTQDSSLKALFEDSGWTYLPAANTSTNNQVAESSTSEQSASQNNEAAKSAENEKDPESAPLLGSSNADSYYVTFNANGGKIGTTYVQATYGEAMPEITAPTKTGCTFLGYFDAKIGGTQYYDAAGKSAHTWDKTANAELYAHWSQVTYSITLDADGGTGGTASVSAKYGSALPAITAPTKTGYTFKGYYDGKTATATKYYDADGTSAKTWDKTSDATLYAIWTANTYTVTLSATDATTAGTTSVTATFGADLPSITIPVKTGYTFSGFYDGTAASATQYYYGNGTSAKAWDKASNTTLYAKWTANTYDIYFDNNDATTAGDTSAIATYGSAMPTITAPAKTGYTLLGYYDGSGDSATKYYNANGTSAQNWDKTTSATLYAKWTVVSCTVTLNNNGATSVGTKSVSATYGQAMTKIIVPAKTGYTFEGYFDDSDCQYYAADGTSAKDWDKTTSTATLTAKWTVNSYNIVLDPNGGSGGSSIVVVDYGATMPTIIPPTYDGFIFGGYYDSKTTETNQYYDKDGKGITGKTWNITSDTTLYAHWSSAKKTRRVTNVSYTGSSGSEQKVNFVPAFNDTNNTYLKDNGVEYYTDEDCKTPATEINNLISSGCTMNQLYQKLLKDSSASTKECKDLWAKANSGVVFYGVLNETWNYVFDRSTTSGIANNYNTTSNFYSFINDDNGIGTVYFDSKKTYNPLSTGYWDHSNASSAPTLNGVNYSPWGSDGSSDTNTFYGAYGGLSGGVLSSFSNIPWSSCAYDGSRAYYWYVDSGNWRYYSRADYGGVVVSQAF